MFRSADIPNEKDRIELKRPEMSSFSRQVVASADTVDSGGGTRYCVPALRYGLATAWGFGSDRGISSMGAAGNPSLTGIGFYIRSLKRSEK